MSNRTKSTSGFALGEGLIAIVAFLVIIIVGLAIFRAGHHTKVAVTNPTISSTNAVKATNSYAVLAPATVPPKVAECSQQLSYSSDGNSSPISCADGDLNILEWNALSALEPSVMSLGYNASETQVQSAICSDASDSDSDANTSSANDIETTTYQISALYYGWSFATNPIAALSDSGCK